MRGAPAARRAASRCIGWVAAATVLSASAACRSDRAAPAEVNVKLRDRALEAGLAHMPSDPPRPIDNQHDAERIALGHVLFFDPILSGPKDVACSTCHLPRLAFADGRQFPSGAGGEGLGPDRTLPHPAPLREMPRNSPPTLNLGMFGRMSPEPSARATMFWSGSAFGLEDQVLNPISADNELRGLTYAKAVARDSVLERLRITPGYVARFRAAFSQAPNGGDDLPENRITTVTLRRAIAAYLRELNTPNAPIDAYLRGDDAALDDDQRAGLELFIGKAGCVTCHMGPLLSDFSLHVLGTAQEGIGRDTTPGDDLGWGEQGGTPYAFRTPPLRQVALTPPYFHAGTAATLEDVVWFKNRGRSEYTRVGPSALDPYVRPLGLSEREVGLVVAFLHALTDTVTTRGTLFHAPPAVPSGLTIPK